MAPNNRDAFEQLLHAGRIRIHRGVLFSQQPAPLPDRFSFSRVEGMMLGLAIGDALGNTSEGMWPAQRRTAFGEIRDYRQHPRWKDRRGYPSDDSQLAFWTLDQMLANGGFDPERVARRFNQGEIFGIGSAVREFTANRKSGRPWQECGVRSAGNGALMRIAPILIQHLRDPSPDLWVDTALCAMLTHNDSASIASCLAFVAILWDLLRRDAPPEPRWWLERAVGLLKDLECDDSYEPRSPAVKGFRGTLWQFLEQELPAAMEKQVPIVDACNRWFSAAYLLETVPCALYILMRHGHDPEAAVVRAVNDTWDNDTIGAIVGAAVGALHGAEALPQRWLEGLSGRTRLDDDGAMTGLLSAAERRWWR